MTWHEIIWQEIINFFLYPQFTGGLLVIKIIFIGFSLIYAFFIVYALIKTKWLKHLILWNLKEFLTYRHYGIERVERKWKKIKKRLEKEIESEWKLAIIEAEEILDGILKQMGFEGASFGERLDKFKLSGASLPNIDEVYQAHQIRNNIIYDPAYQLTLEETQRMITIYEKALTHLQAL